MTLPDPQATCASTLSTGPGREGSVEELANAMKEVQRAWTELSEQLMANTELSDQDRAEGHQYLTGLLSWSMERASSHRNAESPYFMRWFDNFRKFGLENPDNHYVSAEIDGRGCYRLRGSHGGAADIVWQVLDTNPGDGGLGRLVSSIDLGELELDDSGQYEILIGGAPREKNWLATDDSACVLLGRQCFSDWDQQHLGAMQIERMDAASVESPGLNSPHMVGRLRQAASLLRNQVNFWQQYIEPWCQRPVNTLSAPKWTEGGVANQMISTGWVSLAPGQGLLVEVPHCAVRYQGFQLGHRWWFNTFDYRCRQSSLNGAQARLSADGIYRYVICAEDPGVANWLDTEGHRQALVSIRWQGIGDDQPQAPRVSLVQLAELRKHLPADEPLISAAQRQAQLRRRRQGIDRRYGT